MMTSGKDFLKSDVLSWWRWYIPTRCSMQGPQNCTQVLNRISNAALYKPVHATRVVVCVSKNSRSRSLRLDFFRCVLWLNDISYTQRKCLNGQNGINLPARNTPVQLLALYTDPESHNAQRYTEYRRTDRQTDDRMIPIANHTV